MHVICKWDLIFVFHRTILLSKQSVFSTLHAIYRFYINECMYWYRSTCCLCSLFEIKRNAVWNVRNCVYLVNGNAALLVQTTLDSSIVLIHNCIDELLKVMQNQSYHITIMLNCNISFKWYVGSASAHVVAYSTVTYYLYWYWLW